MVEIELTEHADFPVGIKVIGAESSRLDEAWAILNKVGIHKNDEYV